MLTALQLKNFKSWREAEVKLAPITGFFGTNSSGKSSLLQALLLMKQSAENSDQKQVLEFGNEKSLVQLGSFQDVIWQHETRETLGLGVSWNLSSSLKLSNNNKPIWETRLESKFPKRSKIQNIDFLVKIFQENNILFLDNVVYEFEGGAIESKSKPIENLNSSKFLESLTNRKFYQIDPQDKINQMGTNKDIKWSSDLELSLEQALSKLYYLGPIRAFPKRTYIWTGAAPSNVGKEGENTIATLIASRVNGAKVGDTPLEAYIAQKLEQLGLIHGFKLVQSQEDSNYYRVRLQLTSESPEVYLTDVGFGISQFIPIIVADLQLGDESLLVVSQPETHLHPSIQAEFADYLVRQIKHTKKRYIIETHSEYIINRLRLALSKNEVQEEDIAAYYLQNSGKGTETFRLGLHKNGQITNAPEDFFKTYMMDVMNIALN